MKHKFLIGLVVTMGLATSTSIITTAQSQQVQAAHYSKGYKKWVKKSLYSGRYYTTIKWD